jgi:hypothetical protein
VNVVGRSIAHKSRFATNPGEGHPLLAARLRPRLDCLRPASRRAASPLRPPPRIVNETPIIIGATLDIVAPRVRRHTLEVIE